MCMSVFVCSSKMKCKLDTLKKASPNYYYNADRAQVSVMHTRGRGRIMTEGKEYRK